MTMCFAYLGLGGVSVPTVSPGYSLPLHPCSCLQHLLFFFKAFQVVALAFVATAFSSTCVSDPVLFLFLCFRRP